MNATEGVTPVRGAHADLLLAGGRVIDPETGHDAVADVAVADGRIVAVGRDLVTSAVRVDCSGLVVCPGFIDLHSHAQSLAGARLQVLDGVTTALELECGALPISTWSERAADEGRPLNYGYSASWAQARAQAGSHARDHRHPTATSGATPFAAFQTLAGRCGWNRPLTTSERDRLVDLLEDQLAAGAIGIGMLLGYAPDAERSEVEAMAALSARCSSAVFVHSRSSARTGPVTALDAVSELVDTAERTGGHLHLCHVNSTSSSWLAEILDAIEGARHDGLRVSTEAYPYARGSTVVGAAFLSPDELAREGRLPASLTYLATGESIADAGRLEQLRRADPGGLVLTTTYDRTDPAESLLFDRALTVPHSAFASDAMPVWPATADRWPLPADAVTHPRSAGCFTKVLRWMVRERGLLTLPEAIRRCTLIPAEILRQAAPLMRHKGRLGPGADADLIAFDPQHVSDRADYLTLHASTGVRHVLVSGTFVVRDGALLTDALPGRAITSAAVPNGSRPAVAPVEAVLAGDAPRTP